MRLDEKLKGLSSYPFHMPGHKRNSAFNIPSSEIDITEIDGFDNLHNAKDVLYQLQEDIARTFGYEKSIISVNGSTCCILSAISAVCNKGDKIIIARNCHKSVYNACFINELDVEYIEPEYNDELGIYTKIRQSDVDKAIKENKDAKALVITSPTYEGFVSEIKCDIPLIIDSAHGAHFGFANWLPQKSNGDIVIHSLHKTLPALTQSAVIHINNQELYKRVKMYMDIFETSSPSYVILDSIDRCVDFLKNSSKAFKDYKAMLDKFYQEVVEIEDLSILKNDDITRIIATKKGLSGYELAKKLRDCYNIEVEGVGLNYVILISTVCDTAEGFNSLSLALRKIKGDNNFKNSISAKPEIPKKLFKASDITNTTATDIDSCVGKICGEYIYAYPPDVPIIVPGEEITAQATALIKEMYKKGVNIISDSDLLPLKILTKV